MQSRFEKVIVIGYGKIARDVLRYVAERQTVFKYQTLCIEYEIHGISKLCVLCNEIGVSYMQILDRKKLTEKLLTFTEPSLVISAWNTYLFPESVVEKRNLEIINFHNALLPKYPGRNAQCWAIYKNETVSGATWHYVTAGVDDGAIIAQQEVQITQDIKAYELTQSIIAKAFEAFQGFFEKLLLENIEGKLQPKQSGKRKIYYSWELPEGGICSINDSSENIYRILRAMDYGKADDFPPTQLELMDGRKVKVVRYKKQQKKHLSSGEKILLNEEEKRVYLAMDQESELEIKFQ